MNFKICISVFFFIIKCCYTLEYRDAMEIYCCGKANRTQATVPTGCSQPVTVVAGSSGSSFLRDAGLTQWAGSAPGLPIIGNVLKTALQAQTLPTRLFLSFLLPLFQRRQTCMEVCRLSLLAQASSPFSFISTPSLPRAPRNLLLI